MLQKQLNRIRRHRRVRAKIRGTAARPRLSVFRSNKYLLAQLIDDTIGKTLVYADTSKLGKVKTADKIASLTKALSEKAAAAGIREVVFDRGGFKYHGQIAALAESLRKAGLKF